MKLKELINEYEVYKKAENEIREWVEKSYPTLTIIFEPHIELVRTDEKVDFTPDRVQKIVEIVNIKIGEILEKYDEEIVIAERLTTSNLLNNNLLSVNIKKVSNWFTSRGLQLPKLVQTILDTLK